MSLITSLIIGFVVGILLVCFYAAEHFANVRRARRGEELKRHHDLTDHPAPVDVIDWTRR